MWRAKRSEGGVGRLKLSDVLGIEQLEFAVDKFLAKTGRRGEYARTDIPSGDPDDLLMAVSVTAASAVTGFLAIVIASMQK